eukprot:4559202-Pleurochrysis_carterae.AAC.1
MVLRETSGVQRREPASPAHSVPRLSSPWLGPSEHPNVSAAGVAAALVPAASMSTFSSLRSRCAIGGRCECRCATPLHASRNAERHSEHGARWLRVGYGGD